MDCHSVVTSMHLRNQCLNVHVTSLFGKPDPLGLKELTSATPKATAYEFKRDRSVSPFFLMTSCLNPRCLELASSARAWHLLENSLESFSCGRRPSYAVECYSCIAQVRSEVRSRQGSFTPDEVQDCGQSALDRKQTAKCGVTCSACAWRLV